MCSQSFIVCGARLLGADSVILCEEHGNDPDHTVSRYILDQTPLKLIVYDPRSKRLPLISALLRSFGKFCPAGSIAIALCEPNGRLETSTDQ